jgi:anti-sigma factor RsiW
MACKTFETRIPEYVDNTLPLAERARVEEHLARCPACRAFASQWRELDAAFTAGIKAPALSDEFNRRLRQRIQAATQPLSEAERQQRRRALQVEFEAGCSRLRRQALGVPRLLGLLAYGAIGAVIGWMLLESAPLLARLLHHWTSQNSSPNLLAAMVAGALCLSLGLFIVVHQRYRRAQVV